MLRVCVQCEAASCRGSFWRRGDGNGCEGGENTAVLDVQGSWRIPLEKDDGVEQSGAPRLRLMVLTSDKAWPYSWRENKFTRDCHVNCEVERVWRTVKGDVTEWFSTDGENNFTPKKRLLIGTPGIGKSVAAGLDPFYQLPHCDVEKLPVVAYSFGGSMRYVFEKAIKTVTGYVGTGASEDVLYDLWLWKMKWYIIYDVIKKTLQ
ncbi:putative retrotransposon hot spot protein (RHS) [Trypanosoma cruzi]|uniref:Putative retrotransposon hot spot protein (RHS) n=1 Tax=Trypanosoma cruzi TaxID=5693 RepID=A0A2V2VB38_TRYCR|nr:putative retrotransposon hot spot protein (RHS) [Trypanosoma cruzi]